MTSGTPSAKELKGNKAGESQHGQEGPTASRPTFRLIQLLRALAALMVVVHHGTIMLSERTRLPIGNWVNGGSGVDLFFVISGFVMTLSSAPLRAVAHPARTFLARRLERVVPMYWIVTTAKVAMLLLVPALGFNALGSVRHVLASYLFLPSLSPEGTLEPVVVVGWTLNFEMAFYLLFAGALAMRRRPLPLLAVPLALVCLAALARSPGSAPTPWFYSNTLLLEFLFGMVLGAALPWLLRLPAALGLALVAAGWMPLLLWWEPNFSFWRGIFWGLPAVAMVAGAISMEARWGSRSPRWALALGDASYSIYLIHTFVLPALGLLLVRLPAGGTSEAVLALVGAVLLSVVAGLACYQVVERPINSWFKGRRTTAIPALG